MSKSVAVIGAGFGGLALAIRLQSAGIQTLLLEKRERPGGRAYVYEQDGFTFDAGPTVITAPNAVDELFALTGRATGDYIELLPVEPFYRLVWPDGVTLEYNADADAVAAAIARINPADADGYRKFLKFSEAVFREGYLKLGTVPFQDVWSMVRVAPELIRLRSHRSVYSVVAGYMQDPHLRQAFSFQSLLIGGNPFQVSSIYALIHALERQWGVRFPRGGTGALVRALVRLFQDLGGQVRLGCPSRRFGCAMAGPRKWRRRTVAAWSWTQWPATQTWCIPTRSSSPAPTGGRPWPGALPASTSAIRCSSSTSG